MYSKKIEILFALLHNINLQIKDICIKYYYIILYENMHKYIIIFVTKIMFNLICRLKFRLIGILVENILLVSTESIYQK